MRASPKQLILNYLAVMSLLLAGYLFYTTAPYYQQWFSSLHHIGSFRLHDQQILLTCLLAYAVLLIPFYATFDDKVVTKSRRVWNFLLNLHKRLPTPEEKVALLSTLVKAFFLPLMVVWLVHHFVAAYQYGIPFTSGSNFFPNGYQFIFNLILLVDVTFFTLGYALEHPRLNNEIRSADPWFSGWFIALICYPPFNNVTNQLLVWHSSDYPQFSATWAQYVAGISILILMSIYAWASVALNLKASNLTNRGIVVRGPYSWVRHPAYCTKTLAWWVGSIPILVDKWALGLTPFFYGIFCIGGWTLIYYLRAITEERHLSLDPDYRAYCEKVGRRFIPEFRSRAVHANPHVH